MWWCTSHLKKNIYFFFNSPCHHSYSLFKNVINILLNIFARENNSHAGLIECSIPLIRIDVSLSTWTLGRGHVEINQQDCTEPFCSMTYTSTHAAFDPPQSSSRICTFLRKRWSLMTQVHTSCTSKVNDDANAKCTCPRSLFSGEGTAAIPEFFKTISNHHQIGYEVSLLC